MVNVGNSCALATPICSPAAATWRSAWATSGRWMSNSAGTPGGTAGGDCVCRGRTGDGETAGGLSAEGGDRVFQVGALAEVVRQIGLGIGLLGPGALEIEWVAGAGVQAFLVETDLLAAQFERVAQDVRLAIKGAQLEVIGRQIGGQAQEHAPGVRLGGLGGRDGAAVGVPDAAEDVQFVGGGQRGAKVVDRFGARLNIDRRIAKAALARGARQVAQAGNATEQLAPLRG